MVQTFPLAAEAQQPVAAVAGLAAVLSRVQPHLVAAAVAEFAAENRKGSLSDSYYLPNTMQYIYQYISFEVKTQ